MSRFEYKVVEIRERSGRVGAERLQQVLNEHGAAGWQLRSLIEADVKGRVGGGVEGMVLTFERAAD